MDSYRQDSDSDEIMQQNTSESAAFRRYQPGQYLEPILTGETLELEDQPYDNSPHEYYRDQDYVPPSNNPSFISYDTQPEYTLPEDYEAYASGVYGYSRHLPTRSRSPTPAVDDEDYRIVNDHSFHYIGDPEKGMLRDHWQSDYPARMSRTLSYASEEKSPETLHSDLEPPIETRHFGPAPVGRVVRRHKSKKRVQLTNGNLRVDLPIPPRLVLPFRREPETMAMRYTAVTCDPDDFQRKGYTLRQLEYKRKTEIFIVITMYNVSHSYSFTVFLIFTLGR